MPTYFRKGIPWAPCHGGLRPPGTARPPPVGPYSLHNCPLETVQLQLPYKYVLAAFSTFTSPSLCCLGFISDQTPVAAEKVTGGWGWLAGIDGRATSTPDPRVALCLPWSCVHTAQGNERGWPMHWGPVSPPPARKPPPQKKRA